MEIESELPNGKCVDFRMSGKVYLVEVLNLQLNQELGVSDNPENIRKFIEGRITHKIRAKAKGLTGKIPFTIARTTAICVS